LHTAGARARSPRRLSRSMICATVSLCLAHCMSGSTIPPQRRWTSCVPAACRTRRLCGSRCARRPRVVACVRPYEQRCASSLPTSVIAGRCGLSASSSRNSLHHPSTSGGQGRSFSASVPSTRPRPRAARCAIRGRCPGGRIPRLEYRSGLTDVNERPRCKLSSVDHARGTGNASAH
jgi:hypothetical protein